MKVDQQADLQAKQAEMREQLRVINGMQLFLAFEFYGDTALNHQISPKSTL